MTFDEILAEQKKIKTRIKPNDIEHRLQCSCFRWFCLQYPNLRGLLFSVPNGGQRNKIVAAKLKAEGVVAGVSDMILLKANNKYNALCIEMKTGKGVQTPAQKEWQKMVEGNGSRYEVCRSISQFMEIVNDYLK